MSSAIYRPSQSACLCFGHFVCRSYGLGGRSHLAEIYYDLDPDRRNSDCRDDGDPDPDPDHCGSCRVDYSDSVGRTSAVVVADVGKVAAGKGSETGHPAASSCLPFVVVESYSTGLVP